MELNKVYIAGNLTIDPELRYTPTGTAICDLSMAINQRYKTKEGETRVETTFVDIQAWGKTGESCKEFLTKGSPVFVEGELRLDQWESNGEKRTKLRVRADRVQFLDRKPKP